MDQWMFVTGLIATILGAFAALVLMRYRQGPQSGGGRRSPMVRDEGRHVGDLRGDAAGRMSGPDSGDGGSDAGGGE